jgi:hypothetical protein
MTLYGKHLIQRTNYFALLYLIFLLPTAACGIAVRLT